ncbi:FAD-dependent oxidoreductase [Nocardioides panacisoli]|uniref:FAD-dependent oxidoreductase n=1 Tax=Nocardioides panacisoli TaxID=627624 RepID=UPI001C6333EB|nr:FAD-dependent oxidoreductase [Nocardioides panacisoli]QYJ03148.1 FAD-dependent oxidoreductase [Nocardioides panacisoli]
MTRHVVVIGAGMAAVRLVEELRARGSRDPITLIGAEEHAPYNRILLSAVLEGTHRAEALALRPEEWYAEHDVDLRRGTRVVRIDCDRRAVELADGSEVAYDALVLATGAIPTLPPIRGLVDADGGLHPAVHAFRSLDDCHRLDAAVTERLSAHFFPVESAVVPAGRGDVPTRPTTSEHSTDDKCRLNPRAVVVGGGLLGLQVARALAVRGLAVEVVEGGEHLLRSQVGPDAGRVLARSLARLGTEVYTGARVVRLHDHGEASARRIGAELDNGHTLDADLVVLTAGGRPATGLARAAGLAVGRGVVVDDRLTSVSDDHVHAIGDCAEHAGHVHGFVPPAWEQATVLADVLTGDPTTYDGSRIVARLRATDLDVAVLGDPEREARAGGEVVEVSNPFRGSHRRLVVRDGRIVAGTLVGDLRHVGLITQHYDRRTVLAPDEPGDLLLPPPPPTDAAPLVDLPDDAEVCTCAGVSAGAVRACSDVEQARTTTRATTGCGGCTATVRQLLAQR